MRLSVAQEAALEWFAEQDGPSVSDRISGRTIQSLWQLGLLEPVRGQGNIITPAGLAVITPTWNVTGVLLSHGGPTGTSRQSVDRFVVARSAEAAIQLVNCEALRDHQLLLSARAVRRREIAGVPIQCASVHPYPV